MNYFIVCILRGIGLLTATMTIILLGWIFVSGIFNGISAKLMGFEQEPSQGLDYWWWFYFNQNLGSHIAFAVILLALSAVVLWAWIVFVRSIAIRSNRQR